MHPFTAHPERLAAGRQDLQVRAAGQKVLDQGSDLDDEVLAVVDHQHHAALADPIEDRVQLQLLAERKDRQRGPDRAHDRAGVGDRSEIDEEQSLFELAQVAMTELDGGAASCQHHPCPSA